VFPHEEWARGCLWKGILKLCGTAIAKREVKTPRVIEHFNGLKDRLMCLLMDFVDGVVDELSLEGTEEALNYSVVVTVASAAHAGFELVLDEKLPVWLAGVLDSSIVVV
jgi:hypothetical protein